MTVNYDQAGMICKLYHPAKLLTLLAETVSNEKSTITVLAESITTYHLPVMGAPWTQKLRSASA